MIEAINVKKQFSENVLFYNLNFKILSNQLTIIYGKSGSGKTTLLNMIGGLEKVDSGQILIDDQIVLGTVEERRHKFNFIFQNFALVEEDTIFENLIIALKYVKLSKREKIEQMEEALKFVDLDKDLQTKIYTLSGGEQQRVAIARSLLKPGNIILADEPTGSLDEENKKKVIEILTKIKRHNTIIMVSHDLSLKTYADNIISL